MLGTIDVVVVNDNRETSDEKATKKKRSHDETALSQAMKVKTKGGNGRSTEDFRLLDVMLMRITRNGEVHI